jgi:hypothetical protein
MTMRCCWLVFAVAIIFSATPSVAEQSGGGRLSEHFKNLEPYPAAAKARHARELAAVPFLLSYDNRLDGLETFSKPLIFVSDETKQPEPDTIMFASMSGKCSTLKVAGSDFACRAVAYYQDEEGRGNFVIALDDPTDDYHIITFSGENGRRPLDNLYELPIDRMLLKSQDRPKVDGLPVPIVELSSGICKQLGNFATKRVSSVSCMAIDRNGKKYELQFESDGLPIAVRRVRRSRTGLPAVSPFNQE